VPGGTGPNGVWQPGSLLRRRKEGAAAFSP
jgi:hypothetical protein